MEDISKFLPTTQGIVDFVSHPAMLFVKAHLKYGDVITDTKKVSEEEKIKQKVKKDIMRHLFIWEGKEHKDEIKGYETSYGTSYSEFMKNG